MGGPAVSAAMGSFCRPRPWGHTLLALLLLLMCAAVCGDEDWAEEQAAGDWDEVLAAPEDEAPSPQLPPPPPPPPPPTPDRHRQSPTYTNMRPGYYHPVAASLYNFVPDKGYGQPFIAVPSFQKHGEGQMSSEVVSDASRAWWWSADFQLWAASTPTPSTELSSIPSAAASTPIESEAVHAYERATGDSDGQSGGRPLLVPSARWRSAACVVWRGGAAEAPA